MKAVIDNNARTPVRAHPFDAGLDFFCTSSFTVAANSFFRIDTGVRIAIPRGWVGLLTSKSGLMSKGLTVRGTIDSDYRGTIQPVIFNHSNWDYEFLEGDKVTQLVVVPCLLEDIEIVDKLDETDRGENGFGSTGR